MPELKARTGGTFLYKPPDFDAVSLPVLVADGPLCVARVYNHVERKVVHDLFWIYVVPHGAHIGPFFADIPPAQRAMKDILKQVGPAFFQQPLAWIRRQNVFAQWLYKHVGKPEDLIGGEWIRD